MKKLLSVLVLGALALSLCSCNKNMLDLTYRYDYAYIKLQNGEVIEGPITSWTDYEGEQLQVTINGVTYLTSSYNCTLVYYGVQI